MPPEAYTVAFKQELFDSCYKKIAKRLAKKRKAANKNSDLATTTKALPPGTFGKSATLRAGDLKARSLAQAAAAPTLQKGQSAVTEGPGGIKKDLNDAGTDPHHFQMSMLGKRIKMVKYDKHPNVKLRRNYKDMVSVECTQECIMRQHELVQRRLSEPAHDPNAPPKRKTVWKRRNDSPDLVNINI